MPEEKPSTAAPLTLGRAIARGTVGFTIVSLAGFAVWAFAGSWFYRNVGEAGLYAVSAVVFVALAGLLLHPLVVGPRPVARFYKIFIPAFLAYSVAWSVCWFAWRFGLGEWLGSLAGSAAFAAVLAVGFKNWRPFLLTTLVLFALHSAGYFAGDWFYKFAGAHAREALGVSKATVGLITKLGWGFFYGLGFGAGIGFAFFALQRRTAPAT
jgi:hypothetical protein